VNCAYCHNDAGTVPAAWDASARLPLFETGMVNGELRAALHPDDRLLVPGHPQRSGILSRTAASNGYSRMPPLATFVADPAGVALLTDWIQGELPARQSYANWRDQNIPSGFDTSPTADSDQDGRNNHQEFLALTDPMRPDTPPASLLRIEGETLTLEVPALPGRAVLIERSTNLTDWSRWHVPDNDGIARQPGAPWLLDGPRASANEFFRATIRER
jgi:hypothetical protein